jgi:septal ring factor EnvC (AmiA/AmiB activator)
MRAARQRAGRQLLVNGSSSLSDSARSTAPLFIGIGRSRSTFSIRASVKWNHHFPQTRPDLVIRPMPLATQFLMWKEGQVRQTTSALVRIFWLALIGILVLGAVAAPLGASSRADLESIRRELEREQGRMGQDRTAARALEAELRKTEADAVAVRQRLRQLRTALAERSATLAALERSQAERKRSAARARARLSAEVRIGFIAGRVDQLKMLLNQEDPRNASRAMILHGYVARDRATRIAALMAELEQLDEVQQTAKLQTEELQSLTQSTNAARTELERKREQRQKVLTALGARINSSADRIRLLERNAQELERVLSQVASQAPVPAPPPPVGSTERPGFASLAGKLPWPTRGTFKARFGAARGSGGLTWTGVILAASAGQPIHAVAGGRVVYANWLRGFGLLVIIDHGDGYMSLYGHAREMLRERGDWVETGEILGTVGDSGGQTLPGLYFEIRRNGKPRNPRRWCKGNPNAARVAMRSPASATTQAALGPGSQQVSVVAL